MSRAFMSVICGDISLAFHYHPLWVAVIVAAALLVIFKVKKISRAFDITLWSFGAIMVAVYVFRMASGSGEVVTFSPEESAVYKAFCFIRELF